MKKVESKTYPMRLLWLLPIWVMSGMFNDLILSAIFAGTMAFVTAKIFPWIEYTVTDKETKE